MEVSEKSKILEEIINKRQSVYPPQFTGEEIEREMVEWILQNANESPSHRKTNPWRFHVITRGKFGELKQFLENIIERTFSEKNLQLRTYESISKKLEVTSHLIIISMQRHPENIVPEWEEIAAVSCAVQNIYLSLTVADLGGYWSTPKYFIDSIDQFVSMDEGEKCMGCFYLGVPKVPLPPKPDKGDWHDKVKWY